MHKGTGRSLERECLRKLCSHFCCAQCVWLQLSVYVCYFHRTRLGFSLIYESSSHPIPGISGIVPVLQWLHFDYNNGSVHYLIINNWCVSVYIQISMNTDYSNSFQQSLICSKKTKMTVMTNISSMDDSENSSVSVCYKQLCTLL